MNNLITSIKNPKIVFLKKCLNSRYALKNNCFVLTDLSLIKKASERHLIKQIFALNETSYKEETYLVTKEIFKALNIIGSIVAIATLLKPSDKCANKLIYLDEISNPSNLGKIIYLMHQYGYRDLILSPGTVSLYNKKCLEIAKEHIFDLSIHYGDIAFLKTLKSLGYQIISTGLKSSQLLLKVKATEKYVLVFGNEARGVNQSILKISDQIIRIDIKNIDSLNVASAASIVLSHIHF